MQKGRSSVSACFSSSTSLSYTTSCKPLHGLMILHQDPSSDRSDLFIALGNIFTYLETTGFLPFLQVSDTKEESKVRSNLFENFTYTSSMPQTKTDRLNKTIYPPDSSTTTHHSRKFSSTSDTTNSRGTVRREIKDRSKGGVSMSRLTQPIQ